MGNTSQELSTEPCRLCVIASHFIQYQASLWRALAKRPELDLNVYYLSDHGRRPGYDAQFGQTFQWDIPLDEGYAWTVLPGGMGTPPHSLRWKLNLSPAQLVVGNTADVYLRSDYASPGAIAFLYACLLKRVPVLYRGETTLVHETPSRARLKRAILGPLFRHNIHVLAIGQLATAYAKSLNVPDTRITLSPYNVDDVYWQAMAEKYNPQKERLKELLGLPLDRPVILFCGKVIEKKRPLDLARAMCKLAKQRLVSLLVVGTGDQLEEMKKIVAQSPELTHHFMGFVNQSELPKAYVVADVLCLPSSGSETWGLVVNESMYFDCVPVVSDRVGCASDLVKGVGEIHPVGDVDALTEALNHVINELAERRLLVAARIAEFSLERAAVTITKVALQAAAKNRCRRA